MLVIMAADRLDLGSTVVWTAVTAFVSRFVMPSAILQPDAENPARTRSDHALHNEQEQGNEFDAGVRHH